MSAYRSTLLLLALAAASAFGASVSACAARPLNLEDPADVARLYRRRCGACHTVVSPSEYMPGQWPEILDEFGPRSGLTAVERGYLEPWLIEAASRP